MRHPARKGIALPTIKFGRLIAAILSLQITKSAGAAVFGRESGRQFSYRDLDEHVVLADCTSPSKRFLSQMAYFRGPVRGQPEDVAVVPTPEGQYSLWVDSTTSALFTTTGVTFTAELGPRVTDGEYAGKGNNGWGDFSCWASYQKNVYQWGNVSCSMVYDCDRRQAPASATSSASASATGLPQETSTRRELPTGTIVGASVGAGVGAILIVLWALFLWRYLRNKRKAEALATESAAASEHPAPISTPPPPQELDGQWRGWEVHAHSKEGELDGNPRSELATATLDEKLHSSDTFDSRDNSDALRNEVAGPPQRPG